MHQNDNNKCTHPNTLEIFNRLLDVNNGRDITDIQAVAPNGGGDEHIVIGFIYAKRELVAYINTKTCVGEVFLEAAVLVEDMAASGGVDTLSNDEMNNHLVGYITVDDLVKYLEACPKIDEFLTSNESGVWH